MIRWGSGLALLADPTVLAAACLIADYRMPEIDGLSILRQLRERGWRGQALLVTAFPSARLADQAQAAGYGRVIEKPLVEAALVEAVGRAVAAC